MAEQRPGCGKIFHLFGSQPHRATESCIHRLRIVTQYYNSAGLGCALDRSVALHAKDAVDDREVRSRCRVDVQDGAVNSRPVKHVLGPAIAATWHDAKHVLER